MQHRPQQLRYRRCPSCQVVSQASAFRRAQGPVHAAGQLQRRRCPTCGFIGPLADFAIAERPTDEGETR
jgi:hypothetical protein